MFEGVPTCNMLHVCRAPLALRASQLQGVCAFFQEMFGMMGIHFLSFPFPSQNAYLPNNCAPADVRTAVKGLTATKSARGHGSGFGNPPIQGRQGSRSVPNLGMYLLKTEFHFSVSYPLFAVCAVVFEACARSGEGGHSHPATAEHEVTQWGLLCQWSFVKGWDIEAVCLQG